MHVVWPSKRTLTSWFSEYRLVLAQCSVTFMVTSDIRPTWTLRFISRTSWRLKLVHEHVTTYCTWKLMTLKAMYTCKRRPAHSIFASKKCGKGHFIACYSNSCGQTTFTWSLAQYVLYILWWIMQLVALVSMTSSTAWWRHWRMRIVYDFR